MADSRTPRSSDGSGSASPAPAVTRAAAVLEALAASATGRLTLSDLARELGIPKSSTSNLLLALEEARLINRQGAEFTLGRKLVELGAAYLEPPGRGPGVLQVLRTGAHTLRRDRPHRHAGRNQRDLPGPLRGAPGRPADLQHRRQDAGLPLCRGQGSDRTASRPRHRSDVPRRRRAAGPHPEVAADRCESSRRSCSDIREQGYAFEDEESTTGVVCLAVAVPTQGRPRAQPGAVRHGAEGNLHSRSRERRWSRN